MRNAVIATMLSLLLGGTALGQRTSAPYLVVVHPSNPARSVSRDFLADAFLKKVTRWPNGENIRPVDLRAQSPIRQRFTEEVIGRSLPAVRSYWQQIIFSGRGVPPIEFASEGALLRYVATHRGAVGYVSDAADTRGVEVISIR